MSSPGSARSQQGGSQRGGPSAAAAAPAARPGYPAPLGFDPAKSAGKDAKKEMTSYERAAKRVELPADAYEDLTTHHTPFAKRKGFNPGAKKVNVFINQFRVTNLSAKDAFQYDIALSPEPDHPAVFQKVWDSVAVKKARGNDATWLFDGRKLAWCNKNVKELRIQVDLDAEKGRPTPPGKPPNKFLILIKPTGGIRMAALDAYLKGKASWDNSVLECMSFLDHVLRQGPSERFKLIKRTFFNNASESRQLGTCTEAIKGIYSTIRLNESINSGGLGLGVNVDVANQTFWVGQKFEALVRNYLANVDRRWNAQNPDELARMLAPIKPQGSKHFQQSEPFKALRKLYNIRFEVLHRGKQSGISKEYKVKSFTWDKEQGVMNAQTVTFKKKNAAGKEVTMTIQQYYKEQYNAQLRFPRLPLIETTRAGYFPFEVCEVQRLNPYPFKLDPDQTAEMIKFAVQRPPQRRDQIAKMVANLGWAQDPYLKKFGVAINPTMSKVSAVLIKNPVLQFHSTSTNRASKPLRAGQLDPGTSGRWMLQNLKFIIPHAAPLDSWGFVSLDPGFNNEATKRFADDFVAAFKGHGGKIAAAPVILQAPSTANIGENIKNIYTEVGNKNKKIPQLIFFIIDIRNSALYERIKKNADCRLAFVSQVISSAKARRANPQYHSNVCLKINAKLGGANAQAGKDFFNNVPTMIIGADVSHASPGSPHPSLAAVCASIDRFALRYRAAVQTNGHRVEMISNSTLHSALPDMLTSFKQHHDNKTPQHLFYFRDGVSEGQFSHVLELEVEEFKQIFKKLNCPIPKITVIVATKRHHIRFFPDTGPANGDKNGNALPGTVVEREVTHPFHYDFYLCSHVAIQGTARPVHYNVIHDEIGMKPEALQEMIYHHCYQYCRATTPVSLHPAVYYAHLASNRARAHEDMSESDKDLEKNRGGGSTQGGGQWGKKTQDDEGSSSTGTSGKRLTEARPLLKMGGPEARPGTGDKLRATMWWV
ncbi:Piwi domain-containing protein [Rhypophila decipiens]|uniref:Piwi domain-containing protein n=1 Tax=Rhypophila decipiens TaxID=261697 RepID=A0AAN6YHV7_9PEZI|nr:Piwi domain-containing protein [Rhypophila decipiens]